jgi:hypothetical protein
VCPHAEAIRDCRGALASAFDNARYNSLIVAPWADLPIPLFAPLVHLRAYRPGPTHPGARAFAFVIYEMLNRCTRSIPFRRRQEVQRTAANERSEAPGHAMARWAMKTGIAHPPRGNGRQQQLQDEETNPSDKTHPDREVGPQAEGLELEDNRAAEGEANRNLRSTYLPMEAMSVMTRRIFSAFARASGVLAVLAACNDIYGYPLPEQLLHQDHCTTPRSRSTTAASACTRTQSQLQRHHFRRNARKQPVGRSELHVE